MLDFTMKRLWSSPSVVRCDLVRSVLEGSGIPVELRNDLNAQFTGVGYPVPGGQALTFAWPELWVREADFEQAHALIRDLIQDANPPEHPTD